MRKTTALKSLPQHLLQSRQRNFYASLLHFLSFFSPRYHSMAEWTPFFDWQYGITVWSFASSPATEHKNQGDTPFGN
jgi:hypothetical protein